MHVFSLKRAKKSVATFALARVVFEQSEKSDEACYIPNKKSCFLLAQRAKRRKRSKKIKQKMKVKIYKPTKSAMQSGKSNTKKWLLIPVEEKNPRSLNPLTGWVSSDNTTSQLKIFFATKDAAIDYARSQKFEYEVDEPEVSLVKKKSYSANFTN